MSSLFTPADEARLEKMRSEIEEEAKLMRLFEAAGLRISAAQLRSKVQTLCKSYNKFLNKRLQVKTP